MPFCMAYSMANLVGSSLIVNSCTLKCSKCISDHLKTFGFRGPAPGSTQTPCHFALDLQASEYLYAKYSLSQLLIFILNSPNNYPSLPREGPPRLCMHWGPHSPKCGTDRINIIISQFEAPNDSAFSNNIKGVISFW